MFKHVLLSAALSAAPLAALAQMETWEGTWEYFSDLGWGFEVNIRHQAGQDHGVPMIAFYGPPGGDMTRARALGECPPVFTRDLCQQVWDTQHEITGNTLHLLWEPHAIRLEDNRAVILFRSQADWTERAIVIDRSSDSIIHQVRVMNLDTVSTDAEVVVEHAPHRCDFMQCLEPPYEGREALMGQLAMPNVWEGVQLKIGPALPMLDGNDFDPAQFGAEGYDDFIVFDGMEGDLPGMGIYATPYGLRNLQGGIAIRLRSAPSRDAAEGGMLLAEGSDIWAMDCTPEVDNIAFDMGDLQARRAILDPVWCLVIDYNSDTTGWLPGRFLDPLLP